MSLVPGQVLDDRYAVERLIGEGGLAEVYLVRHLALGSRHALKVLSFYRPSLDRRLLLEGRIQAQLRHPNIVPVTDVTRVDGRAALLMEFVDGPTLDQLLATRTVDVLDVFAGILAAVVLAHDAGVLHRDLKPQNILVDLSSGRPVPRVTDFGLAKLVADEMSGSSTRSNVTMGTPGYMAPEQVRDAAAVDARTDVFALGAILHEMYTGRPAFADADGDIEITATIERVAAPLPDHVPAHVREAVAAALSSDPDARPADARALADRLFPAGDPRHAAVLALAATPMAVETRDGPLPTWSSRVPSAAPPSTVVPQPSGAPWIFLGAAAVLVGMLAAVVWLRPAEAPVPEPAPALAPAPSPPPVPSPDPVPVPVEPPAPEPLAEAPPVPTPAAPTPAVPIAAPPEPVPAPAPPPEVAPEVPPPPPPEVAPAPAPDVVPATTSPTVDPLGTWSGVAQGRPLELRVLRVSDDEVRADLVFLGPSPRTTPMVGRLEGAQLRLSASDASLTLSAQVSGNTLAGSYGNGKKDVAFSLKR